MKGWDAIFKDLEDKSSEAIEQTECTIHEDIEGTYIHRDEGDVFYSEKSFEIGMIFGECLLSVPAIPEAIIKKEKLPFDIPSSKYLFVDTETTGLNTGGGSYAVLVGLGSFEDDKFVVRRWFLPDPASELTLLIELREIFEKYDLIVSYNGKSYDMNLLQSRYDFHGINYRIKDKYQLDLLHLVRRFWRGKLTDCSLQTIEREILKYDRVDEDEIPGWKIPWAYFNFLETGYTGDIVKIHDHNTIDILSMPVLLDYLSNIIANPSAVPEHLFPCSKYYEVAGMTDKAVGILESNQEDETDESTLLRLSLLYKRRADYQNAVPVWEQLAKTDNLTALEELAKYAEHKSKNSELALQYTEQAMAFLQSLPLANSDYHAKWQHRKQRLTAKLQRSKS